MLEETTSLYAFPSHNRVKSEHTLVKNGQTNGSNGRSISPEHQSDSPRGMNLMGWGQCGIPSKVNGNRSSHLSEHLSRANLCALSGGMYASDVEQ